jgi:hypothetical protein
MAITLVGTIKQAQAADNPQTPTGLNTAGANLLIGVRHEYQPATPGTLGDTFTNTWDPRTAYSQASIARVCISYATNVGAKVGADHRLTDTGTGVLGGVSLAAFSGAHATAPYHSENGAGTGGNTVLKAGPVTPPEDGCLIVAVLCYATVTTPISIDSGFSTPAQIVYDNVVTGSRGLAFSYLIQGAAATVDPEWSHGSTFDGVAAVAVFLPGAGGPSNLNVLIGEPICGSSVLD